jgi:hypothetical protein
VLFVIASILSLSEFVFPLVEIGDQLVEGNLNEGWSVQGAEDWSIIEPDGEQLPAAKKENAMTKKESSFRWRGGKERQTTGIWMWSEPFIRYTANKEKLAVLLMDTQGMFDNETSMTLTAQIFGLSTLVSSYQV